MESVQHLLEAFDELAEHLYRAELEPDPKRTDWAARRESVDELVALYEKQLVPALDAVGTELEERIVVALETRGAYLGLGVFAALHASGQSGRALPLLAVVAERARRGESAALFSAAGRDVAGAVELARLRHRLANGLANTRPALKQLAKATREKAIAEEALETFHAPQPIRSAPGLGTINGFGTGLYGSRDPDASDGSVIKTLCFSALYVPVFPLSAYRVVDHGDGSYSFMSKNRLSGFARGFRKFLAATALILLAWWGVSSYLHSAGRLAGKDVAAAAALREAGDSPGALSAYEDVVSTWANRANDDLVAAAAKSAFDLRVAALPSPLTIDKVGAATQVIRLYNGYPFAAKSTANAGAVADKVLSWTRELGTESTMAMNAALAVLDEGLDAAGARRPELEDERRAIQTKLAKELSPRRPIEALVMLVELGAEEAAAHLATEISASPSLLREAGSVLDAWMPDKQPSADLRGALATARAAALDEERLAALASNESSLLEAALRKHPSDHELAAALAELDRASGKSEDAVARLTALAAPGWLTGQAQQTLAAAYADVGKLAEADAILSELLSARLPAFKQTSAAYYKGAEAVRERLANQAETGGGPAALQTAIRSGNDAAAMAAFNDWVFEQMNSDAGLARLKLEYEQHVYVVPASLTLGTIKLRRANEVAGAERDKLLAEAEAAFLAISDDAIGVPSYHLGLGQVYHRLGKTAEGDAELQGLLDRGEPELSLAVSRAYRELGLTARSIEIGEKVYNSSASPIRETAASQLSYIVSGLDEQEKWLELSDKSDPIVQSNLRQVRARRAAERGDDAEAAKLFREVAAFWEKNAEHNSSAANNAAVAYLEIYSVSGDTAQLARARKGLEASLRLEPGNALVISNLANHCNFEGWLGALASYLPVDELALNGSDVETLVASLTDGELRGALLEAAKKNPVLRRERELTGQAIALAPGAVAGWERAARWASLTRDGAAIKDLAARIETVKLDTSRGDASRAAWRAGESDADLDEQLAREVTRLETMLAAAQRAKSKNGEAVARTLLANALGRRGWTKSDVDSMASALEHASAATKLWKALGDTTSGIGLQLAVIRSAAASPEVASLFKEDWRDFDVVMLLVRGLLGPNSEAIRKAVGKDRVLPTVTASRLADPSDEATVTDWVLGKLVDNSVLAARGAEIFEHPYRLTETKLYGRMTPTALSPKLKVEFLESRGAISSATP